MLQLQFWIFLSSHSTCANLIADNFWHEFKWAVWLNIATSQSLDPNQILTEPQPQYLDQYSFSCVRRHHPTTSQDMTLMKYTDGNYLIIDGLLLSPSSIIRICENGNWFQQTLEDWKSITKRLQNPQIHKCSVLMVTDDHTTLSSFGIIHHLLL